MFDKAHLRFDGVISDATIRDVIMSNSLSRFGVTDNGYDDALVVRKDGEHLITIKRFPKRSNLWPTYLELNPRRLNSFQGVCDLLSKFNIKGANCEIRRIDHAADLVIPMNLVRSSLIVKRKKKRTEFSEYDDVTGLYFGKANEVVAIYDKTKEVAVRSKGRSLIPSNCTRFEVRQKHKKIKYNSLLDLHKYQDYNPYENLQFYQLQKPIMDMDELGYRDRVFREMLEDRGLHGVYKALNRHCNFNRDHKDKLNQTDLSTKITEVYKSNLEKFFMEDR